MSTAIGSIRKSRVSHYNDENMLASYNTRDDTEAVPVSEITRRSVSIATNNLILNVIIQSTIFALVFLSVLFENWFSLDVSMRVSLTIR